MENISFTEICRLLASRCAVVISTPIMGGIRAVSREVVGVRPMILSISVRLQACGCALLLRLSMSMRLQACACVPFIVVR